MKAGVVLDRVMGQLRGGFAGEFNIDVIAYVVHRDVVVVLDFADEIDAGVLGAAAPRQRQLAAWYFDYYRHEVVAPFNWK